MDDIKIVQMYSLELLKELDKVCNENNLTYYIIGGTLLGAIRHKGFIPWDDDVDIAMPRKDYIYLIENSERLFTHPVHLAHYSNTNDSVIQTMVAKLRNTNIIVHYTNNNEIKQRFMSIDVFPIDGTPNNVVLRKIFYFKIMAYRAMFKFTFSQNLETQTANHRTLVEKFLITFSKKFEIGKLINREKTLNKLEKTLQKYTLENSTAYAGTFLGAYMLKEFTKQIYFTERCKYKFEDGEFYGTKYFDGYLKSIYGDYWKLPPVQERIGKHNVIKVELKNEESDSSRG